MDLCKYNIAKHYYAMPNTNILCRSYKHYNAFLLAQMESNVMAPIIIHYLMRCYFFLQFLESVLGLFREQEIYTLQLHLHPNHNHHNHLLKGTSHLIELGFTEQSVMHMCVRLCAAAHAQMCA